MSEEEFFVQWHLTRKCNLKCLHCYENKGRYNELTTGEAMNFIDEFTNTITLWKRVIPLHGALHLTGGEPFLRNDMFEIARYAIKRGLVVRILSNGTLITPEIAKHLRKIGINSVQVSIDGLSELHDKFRGEEGAFEKAVGGANILIKNKINVTINCTISKFNMREVPKIIQLALTLGVKAVRFSRLVPIGRGEKIGDLLLSPEEMHNLFEYLYKKHMAIGDKLKILLQDPLFCLCDQKIKDKSLRFRHTIAIGGCSIGFSGVCLLPDGTVLPCRKLPIPIGNIRNESFREIWLNSKVLKEIRDVRNLKGKCTICSHKYVCKGCRALAYAFTGNYLNSDPQCWYDDRKVM